MDLKQKQRIILNVFSFPLPQEHQTIRLELLHSCPDSFSKRINPKGQKLIVDIKSNELIPSRFTSFDSILSPFMVVGEGYPPSLACLKVGWVGYIKTLPCNQIRSERRILKPQTLFLKIQRKL